MAYNIKDGFYLDTSATVAAATAGGGSAQLDLSAYIDPIARGRTKGTGLAIYKVHWHIQDDGTGKPIDDAEEGTLQYGLMAGLGTGDVATGSAFVPGDTSFSMTNNLLVSSEQFFGPKSMAGNASAVPTMLTPGVDPSIEVPYVVVRDNVCLIYGVGENMTNESTISCRIECSQITLDQATLNQLLRTQTV